MNNFHAEVVQTRLNNHDDTYAVADLINDAYKEGRKVTFNGETVYNPHGNPASAWLNGSLSVSVRGRTARTGTRWAKIGRTVTVEVA